MHSIGEANAPRPNPASIGSLSLVEELDSTFDRVTRNAIKLVPIERRQEALRRTRCRGLDNLGNVF